MSAFHDAAILQVGPCVLTDGWEPVCGLVTNQRSLRYPRSSDTGLALQERRVVRQHEVLRWLRRPIAKCILQELDCLLVLDLMSLAQVYQHVLVPLNQDL